MDHASLYLHLAKTPEKKHNKTCVTICTVAKDVETIILNSYICPYSFTPLASKALIPQRFGRDSTKETGISSSIRLRGKVMARNRKPTVTSRQYGKRAVFVSDDVRFQDGDAVDIVKLGGGTKRLLLRSFNVCTCASVCCHHVHA